MCQDSQPYHLIIMSASGSWSIMWSYKLIKFQISGIETTQYQLPLYPWDSNFAGWIVVSVTTLICFCHGNTLVRKNQNVSLRLKLICVNLNLIWGGDIMWLRNNKIHIFSQMNVRCAKYIFFHKWLSDVSRYVTLTLGINSCVIAQ